MKKEPKLEITYVPVADLVPYAGNAKRHPEEQVAQIACSIMEFGNCDPIAVWHDNDGTALIVEGHGRVMALDQLGVKMAPVISLDHLTDAQRRAYTHVHNQTTLSSGFDLETLDAEIEELSSFDWESFGFDVPGIEWDADVPELTDDTYDAPEHDMLRCPKCNHVDRKEHFIKVGTDEDIS